MFVTAEVELRPTTTVLMIRSTEEGLTLSSAILTANVYTTLNSTLLSLHQSPPQIHALSAPPAILYHDHVRFRRPRLALSSNVYMTSQSVPTPVITFFLPRDPDHTTRLDILLQTGSRTNSTASRYPGQYREPTLLPVVRLFTGSLHW